VLVLPAKPTGFDHDLNPATLPVTAQDCAITKRAAFRHNWAATGKTAAGLAINAGWDMEILKLELSELATMDVDIDLTLTGFATGEMTEIEFRTFLFEPL